MEGVNDWRHKKDRCASSVHASKVHYLSWLSRLCWKLACLPTLCIFYSGVLQRNEALYWLRENARLKGGIVDGVIFFADDDNSYDIRIFEEMRHTVRVSLSQFYFQISIVYYPWFLNRTGLVFFAHFMTTQANMFQNSAQILKTLFWQLQENLHESSRDKIKEHPGK